MKPIDWALCAAIALAGCGYRPARFTAERARWSAHDERPIAMPGGRRESRELYYIESYGERALVGTLEVSRPPLGVDVNRLDEVVTSSWYRGQHGKPLAGYETDGAPVEPLTRKDELPAIPDATVVEDARGLRYELLADFPGHPESRTAAVAIASRLLHAVGYRTPEAHVIARGADRAVAVRWPAGVDLGPTPILWTRADDPNDVLPHIHRRTLRASLVFALWLGIDDFREHTFRNVYVGTSPQGFVRHYFVGFEEALGTDSLDDDGQHASNPQEDGSDAGMLLLSFGFAPKGELIPRALPFPGVARFSPEVMLETGGFQPPFPPHHRLRPDDAYWAGKVMASLSTQTIADAVSAGQLSDPRASHYLIRALKLRRDALLREIYGMVSPCELTRIDREGSHFELSLVDSALESGVAKPPRRYRLELVDADGDALAPERTLRFDRQRHTLRLPAHILGDYAIVRLTAFHDGDPIDRTTDFHLGPSKGKLRLLGVEH